MNDRRNAPKKAPPESNGAHACPDYDNELRSPAHKAFAQGKCIPSPRILGSVPMPMHTRSPLFGALLLRGIKRRQMTTTAATKLKVNLTEWETGRESDDDDDDSAIRATQNTALSRAIRSTSDFALAILRRRSRGRRQRRRRFCRISWER